METNFLPHPRPVSPATRRRANAGSTGALPTSLRNAGLALKTNKRVPETARGPTGVPSLHASASKSSPRQRRRPEPERWACAWSSGERAGPAALPRWRQGRARCGARTPGRGSGVRGGGAHLPPAGCGPARQRLPEPPAATQHLPRRSPPASHTPPRLRACLPTFSATLWSRPLPRIRRGSGISERKDRASPPPLPLA